MDADLQWGWRTRFTEIGGTATLGGTKLTAQALTGRTEMGYPMAGRIWVDTTFRSAFALVSQAVGSGSVSGRIEAFGTDGRGSVLGVEESENGWATTIAARRPVGDHVTVLGEALHIESDRGSRLRTGIAPRQEQTVLQLAIRVRQ